MSTTEPAVPAAPAPGVVTIPPGVTVQPGRQTTQTSGFGTVVQGTQYPIVLANGTTSSVFVPDTALSDPAQVEAIFATKIAQLSAIPVG
jgi:hypothetical protein